LSKFELQHPSQCFPVRKRLDLERNNARFVKHIYLSKENHRWLEMGASSALIPCES
jgi:hypothetical protein